MKNKKISVLLTLATFMMSVFGFQSMAQAVDMPSTTDIVLQKLQYVGPNQDGTIPNDGLEKPGIPDGFESYNPELNGDVEFTLVDVTDYVNVQGTEAVQTELAGLTQDGYAAWIASNGTIVESQNVGNDGRVTFSNVDSTLTDNDEFRYYVAFETQTPESVKSPAQPVLIQLPMTNANNNGFLDTVYVYPKNQLEGDKPTPEKNVVDDQGAVIENPSYSIGDDVNYLVNITVPTDVADYVSFDYWDQGQTGLTYTGTPRPELVAVTTDGTQIPLTEGTDYVYSSVDNGFKVDFMVGGSVSDNVALAAGGNITIAYKMTINEEAKVDEGINNDFTLGFTNRPGGDREEEKGSTPVYTGGAKFIKEDGKTSERLEGAEFVIRNEEGNYYGGVVDGKVVWGGITDAEKFTSNAMGEFEITGLEYGEYQLEEIKAPDGYALNSKPIDFTIEKDTYSTEAIRIKNYPKTLLPETGSVALVGMFGLGLALVLSGAVYYKKRATK